MTGRSSMPSPASSVDSSNDMYDKATTAISDYMNELQTQRHFLHDIIEKKNAAKEEGRQLSIKISELRKSNADLSSKTTQNKVVLMDRKSRFATAVTLSEANGVILENIEAKFSILNELLGRARRDHHHDLQDITRLETELSEFVDEKRKFETLFEAARVKAAKDDKRLFVLKNEVDFESKALKDYDDKRTEILMHLQTKWRDLQTVGDEKDHVKRNFKITLKSLAIEIFKASQVRQNLLDAQRQLSTATEEEGKFKVMVRDTKLEFDALSSETTSLEDRMHNLATTETTLLENKLESLLVKARHAHLANTESLRRMRSAVENLSECARNVRHSIRRCVDTVVSRDMAGCQSSAVDSIGTSDDLSAQNKRQVTLLAHVTAESTMLSKAVDKCAEELHLDVTSLRSLERNVLTAKNDRIDNEKGVQKLEEASKLASNRKSKIETTLTTLMQRFKLVVQSAEQGIRAEKDKVHAEMLALENECGVLDRRQSLLDASIAMDRDLETAAEEKTQMLDDPENGEWMDQNIKEAKALRLAAMNMLRDEKVAAEKLLDAKQQETVELQHKLETLKHDASEDASDNAGRDSGEVDRN